MIPEADSHLGVEGNPKAESARKASSFRTRRRKIRTKRLGRSCFVCSCVLPLLVIIAVGFYVRCSQLTNRKVLPHKLWLFTRRWNIKPYLSSSSTTTLRQLLERDTQLEKIFQAAKPVEITIINERKSVVSHDP